MLQQQLYEPNIYIFFFLKKKGNFNEKLKTKKVSSLFTVFFGAALFAGVTFFAGAALLAAVFLAGAIDSNVYFEKTKN